VSSHKYRTIYINTIYLFKLIKCLNSNLLNFCQLRVVFVGIVKIVGPARISVKCQCNENVGPIFKR
jgi:hypothetical protein